MHADILLGKEMRFSYCIKSHLQRSNVNIQRQHSPSCFTVFVLFLNDLQTMYTKAFYPFCYSRERTHEPVKHFEGIPVAIALK